ncbi:MAG: T9SS type A sorting domain-containing protein [Bacteroidota bacterium]
MKKSFLIRMTIIQCFVGLVCISTINAAHFIPVWSGNPLNPMTIGVTEAKLDGVNLSAGDEIGIFDGTYCVGVGILLQPINPANSSTYIYIACSKDDAGTTVIDGYTEGHAIGYKFWKQSTGSEINTVNHAFPYAPLFTYETFTQNETAVVTLSGLVGMYITNVVYTNFTCNNANNGTIVITASGGATPFQYSINNGGAWQTSNSFASLSAGAYILMAKDNDNIMVSYSGNPVIITNPALLEISSVTITNVTNCTGGGNGSIVITASGGTGTFSYSIDNGTTWVANGGTFSNLATGAYQIRVKDANQCFVIYSGNPAVITQPAGVTINSVTVTKVTTIRNNNGKIVISATGGSGTIQYSINNGVSYQSGNVFAGLATGNYMIKVRDNSFCESSYSGNPVSVPYSHFLTVFGGNPLYPMTISATEAKFDGVDLVAGDEIGIFDGVYCVGMTILTQTINPLNTSTYPYISCSKDDPETTTIEGYTEGNTISYKIWKQSGYIESGSVSYIFPYAPLYAFETFVQNETSIVKLFGSVVPASKIIQNDTVHSGQTNCYNATQTITVAGNGTNFIVQNGGAAKMIAGQNIRFLFGTRVNNGGYLWGYIAPNGPYCISLSMPSVVNSEEEIPVSFEQSSFRIYPNPTTGNFTLELKGEDREAKIMVDIYGTRGEKLHSAELSGSLIYQLSLEGKPSGVYFIRVISGNKSETTKIIKR